MIYNNLIYHMKKIILITLLPSLLSTGCFQTKHLITIDHNIKLEIQSSPIELNVTHKFPDSNKTLKEKKKIAEHTSDKLIINNDFSFTDITNE